MNKKLIKVLNDFVKNARDPVNGIFVSDGYLYASNVRAAFKIKCDKTNGEYIHEGAYTTEKYKKMVDGPLKLLKPIIETEKDMCESYDLRFLGDFKTHKNTFIGYFCRGGHVQLNSCSDAILKLNLNELAILTKFSELELINLANVTIYFTYKGSGMKVIKIKNQFFEYILCQCS